MREPEALDPMDAENIEILLETPAWKLIAERIAIDLDVRRAQLEDMQTPESELRHRQGFIAGLRHAWAIPRILVAEARRRGI